MSGANLFDISVDHDLWKLAQKLNELAEMMMEIVQKIGAMEKALKDQNEMYQGKGRDEIDLFINKYAESVSKLSMYYGYCSNYVNTALADMLQFDQSLQKKFEEGIIEFCRTNPNEAKEWFGGQDGEE